MITKKELEALDVKQLASAAVATGWKPASPRGMPPQIAALLEKKKEPLVTHLLLAQERGYDLMVSEETGKVVATLSDTPPKVAVDDDEEEIDIDEELIDEEEEEEPVVQVKKTRKKKEAPPMQTTDTSDLDEKIAALTSSLEEEITALKEELVGVQTTLASLVEAIADVKTDTGRTLNAAMWNYFMETTTMVKREYFDHAYETIPSTEGFVVGEDDEDEAEVVEEDTKGPQVAPSTAPATKKKGAKSTAAKKPKLPGM